MFYVHWDPDHEILWSCLWISTEFPKSMHCFKANLSSFFYNFLSGLAPNTNKKSSNKEKQRDQITSGYYGALADVHAMWIQLKAMMIQILLKMITAIFSVFKQRKWHFLSIFFFVKRVKPIEALELWIILPWANIFDANKNKVNFGMQIIQLKTIDKPLFSTHRAIFWWLVTDIMSWTTSTVYCNCTQTQNSKRDT